MQPRFSLSQSIAALGSGRWCRLGGRPDDRSEGKLHAQPLGVPANNKGGKDRLILTRRGHEEIDYRDLLLDRLAKPAVIGRVRVRAHKCIFDDIIVFVDLTMSLALIVIPRAHPAEGRRSGSTAAPPWDVPQR